MVGEDKLREDYNEQAKREMTLIMEISELRLKLEESEALVRSLCELDAKYKFKVDTMHDSLRAKAFDILRSRMWTGEVSEAFRLLLEGEK